MLTSLSPARRRFVLGLAVVAVTVLVAVLVVVLSGRETPVEPVAQDRPGPVLLVPGYGGSTASLAVLADALVEAGHDARIVAPQGSGTEDLRDQAAHLSSNVDDVLDETGASSVDLVGFSAGGLVVRVYVADLGGGSHVRRAVTLASPHHGTDLAAAAGSLGAEACPEACQQMDPDSDLLRRLNADDETPPGPAWVALWTTDDETVVPPESGSLDGATVDFSVQSICPGRVVGHPDVPRDPAVLAMVASVLSGVSAELPDRSVCSAR